MKNVYCVHYTDAYYTYEKDVSETKLALFEAYGYVERIRNNVVIIFIKKRGANTEKMLEEKETLAQGIIIPDAALLSVLNEYKSDVVKDVSVGSSVTVHWRDVMFVENKPNYDCSTMYTEGVLFKIEKDHIVLKDPQTIRTYPSPVKNHPGSGLPTYLILPISFITELTVLHGKAS